MLLISFIVLSILLTFIFTFIPFINDYVTSYKFIFVLLILFIISFIIVLLLFVLFLLIYLSKVDFNKKVKPSKFDMLLMKAACEAVIMISNIRLHVRGLEKVPRDKKFLLIQNHLSNYDVICTTWALRNFNMAYIFKKSLLKVPFLGKFMHKIDQLPIDREDNRQGLKVIIDAINKIKDDYMNVGVYPEGTRSKDHMLHNFHAGTFKIALKAKCPIVISTIVNTESKKYHTIFRKTNVYFDVVKVLEYDDYKDMTSEEIALYTNSIMRDNLKELEVLDDKAYLKKGVNLK